jgi:V-type H+-transporting ATPase subunit a
MQFTDLQEHLTPFQRRFVSGVKRCEELERKCRFFTGEIAKFGLKLASAGAASSFLDAPLGGSSPGAILSSLESELEEYEKQVPLL